MFVVALDFNTLLNRGIPPSNIIFRACKISAAMISINRSLSDKKSRFLVSSTLILYFMQTAPTVKIMHAKMTVSMTSSFRGSSNL